MRWLRRRLLSVLGHEQRGQTDTGRTERGATAVMVAVLMVPLIGFLAISVDVGALYAERAQLQNGADAAALAVAEDCADGTCTAAAALATAMANANANDGAAAATFAYPTSRSVTVTTTSASMEHPFASALSVLLDGSDTLTTVEARATATWGAPKSGPAVLPLALSFCEFEDFGSLNDSVGITIRYDENRSCSKSGPTIPGGFGWLQQQPGTCQVQVTLSNLMADTIDNRPGNSAPTDCTATLGAIENTTILIPVFDSSTGSGVNGKFHIYAFAAFHITGWKFAGNGVGGNLVNVDPSITCGSCNAGNARFIQGYFEKWVSVSDAFELGGPELNGYNVKLTN
ncbi:hypothetical protein E3T55_01755 [Cryobacterium frigoriphilum]|uniref:Putative Flp pilus-assembly TadG-like N-terminal domain-containing protein n=1 Tax=Cryobacterium frigoriphilum TaxID=1259150 RepID=A0A4R9ABX2_9MICO|nr:pilus assembly protein TadG-related protein [Cryobacterium frigoriphilum]TFD55171.1 hypothetical protein E3T55_01755 [Cryobacterium frigoriphilum]